VSNSRRKFLRTGLLAALFAAVPLKNALSQSWKQNDGNPGETPVTQSDPLGNYSKASFKSYLNSIFQLQTSGGVVQVALTQIDDMPAPKGGECFTLLFRGESRLLPQDTYMITHPALGTFALLLVPAGTDANGAQGYLATINRLSLADFANLSAPTRIARPSRVVNTAPANPTPTPSVAPAVMPTLPAPTVVTPTSTPIRKRKPRQKRKPSWKSNDDSKLMLN